MNEPKKIKQKQTVISTRLIAAAPDLLAACEAACTQERCVCEEAELEDNTCLSCYLGSVINKAKGE